MSLWFAFDTLQTHALMAHMDFGLASVFNTLQPAHANAAFIFYFIFSLALDEHLCAKVTCHNPYNVPIFLQEKEK